MYLLCWATIGVPFSKNGNVAISLLEDTNQPFSLFSMHFHLLLLELPTSRIQAYGISMEIHVNPSFHPILTNCTSCPWPLQVAGHCKCTKDIRCHFYIEFALLFFSSENYPTILLDLYCKCIHFLGALLNNFCLGICSFVGCLSSDWWCLAEKKSCVLCIYKV